MTERNAMDKATLLEAAEHLDALPVDRERCRMLLLPEQAWEEAQERCADALRALAASAAWDGVERRKGGDKWVRVPREPTSEMIQAMEDRHVEGASYIAENSIQYALWCEVYRAMLAAVPKEGG
jgi:hypothetical protein